MKITLRGLIKQKANEDFIAWFNIEYMNEVDSEDVIRKLREIKCSENWMQWLFGNYKLNGLCERWHDNGNLAYRVNFKDGKLDGFCEGWWKNGELDYRHNWKDGKFISREI